ncbi:hypothetical protein EUGRSUZ_E03324 [Eucalyptus grandis]|uniref:Uncharacterized protein n=2 Tax=Eucalyptus grandis TaxID=71139 RepID=A0ACC3KZ16_EUCGR|nr:hypothetical protein EUGRSUZ_E03324 [Eucalyptus grandis]
MESPKFGEDKRSLKDQNKKVEDFEEQEEDEDKSGEARRARLPEFEKGKRSFGKMEVKQVRRGGSRVSH